MAKAAAKPYNGKTARKSARTPAKTPQKLEPDVMSASKRVAWWSLLAMVFLVPIVMSNMTWLTGLGFQVSLPLTYDQFDILKLFFQRVLTLVALGAWSWDILTKGGKIRRTPVDWLVLVFLAWVAVTTFTSIHPATAFFGKYRRFEGLLSFINYAVIYFLIMQFADRPSRVWALAKSLFWSSFVVAGYGVLQRVGLDPVQWGALPFEQFRPFSTYGNPDLLGGFLMFSLPVALALALAETKTSMRLVYWLGFGMNVFVWIVAFTRGAWIGGAFGLVIMIVIAWRHSAKMGWIDWVPVGVTGVLGASAIARSLSNPNEVMNFSKRLASITSFDTGSGKTRTEIWQAAINAIKERPVFGFGADTFRLVFPTYKPVEYVKDAGYLSVADNVHNYPLQLAAGIGIPGVLLLYGVFAWAAIRSFKTVFAKSQDPNRIVLGAFWAAAAGYLLQLMTGLSVTGNSFLLWVAMAVVLAPTASVVEVRAPKWGPIAGGAVLVLIAFGVSYQFVVIAADRAYLKSRIGADGATRTAFAREAIRLNPFNDMYRAEVGLALQDEVLGIYSAMINAQNTGQDISGYDAQFKTKFLQAEAALLDTIEFVPAEYDNYVFLTNLYNSAGRMLDPKYYERAVEIGNKGVEVEQFGPAIRVQRSRALLSLGRLDEALKDAKLAADMDPAYTEATLLEARVYEQMGRTDEALRILRAYEAARPGWPGIADEITALEASQSPAPTTTTP